MLNQLTEYAAVTWARQARHSLIPRVQDAPAHRSAFACVRASMCYGRCVFFVEVAYNDRLPPPIGRVVLVLYYNTLTLRNAHFRLSTCLSVTRRSTLRRSRIVAKRDGPVEIASPRRTVASDFASTASDAPRRDLDGLK